MCYDAELIWTVFFECYQYLVMQKTEEKEVLIK